MLQFIALFFGKTWELLSIKWPGFDFPIWAVFIGVAFAVVALGLIGRMFGVSVGSAFSGAVHAEDTYNMRVAKAKSIKISEKRKGDTH